MSVAHAGVLLFVIDGGDAPSVDFGEAGDETSFNDGECWCL